MNLLAQQPFQFNPPRSSPPKMHLETAVLTIHQHPIGPSEAGNVIGNGESKGLNHLSSLHLLQTEDSRATRVHYQQCSQCHPGLTSQTSQGVPDEVDNTEKKPA